MAKHHRINYLEIPTTNVTDAKAFFSDVFDWTFVDYGPEYTCFTGQNIDGGFYLSETPMRVERGSALIVLYSENLEQTLEKVKSAGAKISQAIFSFPGGRRFHFLDTTGNEFSVWSE
uniref:VOC family protein n=1 Tax=Ningiella ruwaisensis TaxID=2364274 RepID=UPI0010A01E65|nr:VOC family protein [Ningiella ruwaisensis]